MKRKPRTPARSRLIEYLADLGAPWNRITSDEIAGHLDRITREPTAQGRLLAYAKANPGFATNADPDMPRQIQRLLRQLREAGLEIALPRCARCCEERLLEQTGPDGARYCGRCRWVLAAVPCSECHRTRTIYTRQEGRAFCGTCWRRRPEAREQCSRCGVLRLVEQRTDAGPLCPNCATGTIKDCVSCGKHTRITGYILHGAHCRRCYNVVRRITRPCPGCNEQRLIAYLAPDGTAVCASCAGAPQRFGCETCGTEHDLHGRRCYRCVATERLSNLFTRTDGTTATELLPLKKVLLDSGRHKSLALWARRSASAAIVRELVEGNLPCTHEALDTYTIDQAKGIRALLINAGLLSDRDEHLTSYETWLSATLKTIPASHRRIVGPYAHWKLSPQIRRRVAAGTLIVEHLTRCRSKVRSANRFLDYLDGMGLALRDAPQTAIDDYMTAHPQERANLGSFIRWARDARVTTRLKPPRQRYQMPSTAMGDVEYRATIGRLIRGDADMSRRTRIAGLLVGLYGQQLTRIVRLTHADFIPDGREPRLRLGTSPITLPPVLGDLLDDLPSRQFWATSAEPKWLFPSLIAGNHLDASNLSRDLSRAGISTVPLRGAALLNLASQLPGQVLTDLTGIGRGAAARWSEIAASAWNTYPELRSKPNSIWRDETPATARRSLDPFADLREG